MAGQSNLYIHFGGTLHNCVKIVYLKPKQHTVAVRLVSSIADEAVMVFDFKVVQLQNQRAILHQLLVVPAAMGATATQQTLIPLAAGFDVRNTNKRLRSHAQLA